MHRLPHQGAGIGCGITSRTSAGTAAVRMIGASRSRGRLRPVLLTGLAPAVSTCIDMRPTRRWRGDSRNVSVWMRPAEW